LYNLVESILASGLGLCDRTSKHCMSRAKNREQDSFVSGIMEVQPRDIQNYQTADGKNLFSEWLNSLRDSRAKAKIRAKLNQVRLGNLGDCSFVGEGVCELRIDYGPGYRIYFGQIGPIIVLLLCGGDKSTQEQDIRKAIKYWRDYESRDNI
jgi:putative addiction module killer protein